MARLFELLLEARDLGVGISPESGDLSDLRIRARLANTINPTGRQSRGRWPRRFRLTPAAVVIVCALTAATATAAVLGGPVTSLFRANPEATGPDRLFLQQIGHVAPSSVGLVAQKSVPAYGHVQFWAAHTTRAGGFCFALKLPDGAWANDPAESQAALTQAGSMGGTVPGCFTTRRQASIKYREPAASLEAWTADVKSNNGKYWTIYYGYVEARGKPTTVRDARTGYSARVNRHGYYILVDPTPTIAKAGLGPAGSSTLCEGCDLGELQVLNAAGAQLSPNYTARRSQHPARPSSGSGSAGAASGSSS